MKNKKIEIKIPGSLNQIPLTDYIKLLTILENNKDNADKMAKRVVQFYTKDPIEMVDKMKQSDFNLIFDTVMRCLGEKNKLTPVFKHNGITYGFIPKLEDMSVKEYLELDATIGTKETWNEAMSILYRPITEVQGKKKFFGKKSYDRYSIEDYETGKYAEELKDMPSDIVSSAIFFFAILGRDLQKAFRIFLESQLALEKCPVKRDSLMMSIDGINKLELLLEEKAVAVI